MNKRQIALARLALREVQTIQGSCGIFNQYSDELPDSSPLVMIDARMSAMDDTARVLQTKLEKLLAPYEQIDVEEIY